MDVRVTNLRRTEKNLREQMHDKQFGLSLCPHFSFSYLILMASSSFLTPTKSDEIQCEKKTPLELV